MLSDPLFVALVARMGGYVSISEQEIESASGLRVDGSRLPNGEIELRLDA